MNRIHKSRLRDEMGAYVCVDMARERCMTRDSVL
jgi:hypothetical protein